MQPVDNFAPRVLAWFDKYGRKNLPWQENKTPYRVWISEIMLQQTRVTTVIPYYNKFMQSFPIVDVLAKANQNSVLAHWSGLGYYARARYMHKAARILVDEFESEFPNTVAGLCELPGIGRSTASAILSISRGIKTAILDGNVKRVLGRFHAVSSCPGEKKTEMAMWDLAERYMPSERCSDYTQAIMDLGATLCTRFKPKCLLCPLEEDCLARKTEDPMRFPIRKLKKVAKPEKSLQCLVLSNEQQVLMEKRPQTGIWGGLWSLPEFSSEEDIVMHTEQRFQTQVTNITPLNSFRHTFSHYHLDIEPSYIRIDEISVMIEEKYQWFSWKDAIALGLPTPIRSLLNEVRNLIGT